MNPLKTTALLAGWLIAGLCAPAHAGKDPEVAAFDAVKALVGTASCHKDSDCRTIAMPAQACGGPQGWLAYAPAQTDAAALARAMAEWGRQQQARPGKRISTCAVVPDPGAYCAPAVAGTQARSCQLRPTPAGGALQER